MEDKQVRVGVSVLVIKDQSVEKNSNNEAETERKVILMGQRLGSKAHGTWQVPGGGMAFGESFEKAAQREALEETGLSLREEDIEVLGVLNDINLDRGKHFADIYTMVHIGKSASGDGVVMDDSPTIVGKEPLSCAKWEWVPLDNLPQPLFPSMYSFIASKWNTIGMKVGPTPQPAKKEWSAAIHMRLAKSNEIRIEYYVFSVGLSWNS